MDVVEAWHGWEADEGIGSNVRGYRRHVRSPSEVSGEVGKALEVSGEISTEVGKARGSIRGL